MIEKSVQALCAMLRSEVSLQHTMGIDIGQTQVCLRSNSEALIAKLSNYFGALVKSDVAADQADLVFDAIEAPAPRWPLPFADWPRDADKQGRKEAFCDLEGGRVVQKVRTGMHFVVGPKDLVAIGPCVDNDNQITNFINSQYVARKLQEGWQLCHAAGVALDGQGMVIAARAGAGKSTLALYLMSSGLSYVSNDRVLIRQQKTGPTMAGIPKMPRVNPGTLLNNPDLAGILPTARERELRAMDRESLWELEEKYDVMIEDTFGPGRSLPEASLNAMLILNWSAFSQDPTEIVPVDLRTRPDLMELVMKSPGVFHQQFDAVPYPPRQPLDEQAYHEQLSAVPAFEARGRADFATAVRFCRTQLGCRRAV